MIRKRTFGTILCVTGGILALLFGKPVSSDFNTLFAIANIAIVAFGTGLIFGDNGF